MENDVLKLLRGLGVGKIYRGCRAVVIFVELASDDEDRLLNIVETYKEIATRTGTTWTAVERNIRTVVNRAWETNSQLLIEIAGYPMQIPPTASEFLEIIYNHSIRHGVTK
ncbi:MAG: hypothetical protein IJZ88_01610 [Clostridia bacterium]|nr:hypothetical protein [Clostridia bacterium]